MHDSSCATFSVCKCLNSQHNPIASSELTVLQQFHLLCLDITSIWQQHLIHVKQYTQAPDRMKEGDVFKASHDKQAAAMEQGVQVSGNPLESAQVSPAFLAANTQH